MRHQGPGENPYPPQPAPPLVTPTRRRSQPDHPGWMARILFWAAVVIATLLTTILTPMMSSVAIAVGLGVLHLLGRIKGATEPADLRKLPQGHASNPSNAEGPPEVDRTSILVFTTPGGPSAFQCFIRECGLASHGSLDSRGSG